jgi:hypothetical protein
MTFRLIAAKQLQMTIQKTKTGPVESQRFFAVAKMAPLLLLISITLTACAGWFPTEQGYRQVLDTWVGDSGESLVAKWGIPTAEHSSPDGSRIYEFSKTRTYTVSGGTQTEQVVINGHYIDVEVPQPDEVKSTWCRTTFYLAANDIIQSYAFEGPDCTAYETTDKPTTSASFATQRQDATRLCALMDADKSKLAGSDFRLCAPPI